MLLSQFPARFQDKVRVRANGCWEWTACKGKHGHGFFSWQGKQNHAHRIAWQWVHGAINDRRVHLDHFMHPEKGCIGPSCVNPDHVRPTSGRENTLRGRAPSAENLAKRQCPRGHPYSVENTRYMRNGSRYCLSCRRDRANWSGKPAYEERTHCPQGHPYRGDNLYVRPSTGQRECRACKRARSNRAYATKTQRLK